MGAVGYREGAARVPRGYREGTDCLGNTGKRAKGEQGENGEKGEKGQLPGMLYFTMENSPNYVFYEWKFACKIQTFHE